MLTHGLPHGCVGHVVDQLDAAASVAANVARDHLERAVVVAAAAKHRLVVHLEDVVVVLVWRLVNGAPTGHAMANVRRSWRGDRAHG